MKLLVGSATLVLASSLVPNAFAQNDELDVTMQVLDDVHDIERVVASIGPERRAAAERPAAADSPRIASTADGGTPAQREQNRDVLDMKSDLDRDEESEGELEDYDVPEDVVFGRGG